MWTSWHYYIYEAVKTAEYFAASDSDILLYPTLADNCPLVVLEAMACGTPVIAFNTGGVPELVEHLKTGYVAEYKNSDDFINGIYLFIEDDSLRKSAGKKARQVVEKHFALGKMVDSYLDSYQTTIEKLGIPE